MLNMAKEAGRRCLKQQDIGTLRTPNPLIAVKDNLFGTGFVEVKGYKNKK